MCSITTCGFFFSLLEKRKATQAVGFGMSLLMVSCGSVYTRTHMYTTHVPIYLCVSDCLHNVYYRKSEHKIHSGVLDMYPLNTAGFGAWDGSNCRVLNETAEEVECGCDHLTHFAILLVSD